MNKFGTNEMSTFAKESFFIHNMVYEIEQNKSHICIVYLDLSNEYLTMVILDKAGNIVEKYNALKNIWNLANNLSVYLRRYELLESIAKLNKALFNEKEKELKKVLFGNRVFDIKFKG